MGDVASRAVTVVEVAPRDGLQNEAAQLSTAAKVELIGRLVDAGLRSVEVASFVSPRAVPAMADAEAVVAALPPVEGVTYSALVVNRRGVDRAAATGIGELNAVVVCTDTFSRRNQGVDVEGGLSAWHDIAAACREAGITPTVTLSAAFGCPFEGEVPVERVAAIAARVAEDGPAQLSLADTIGVAAPTDVTERVAAVRASVPPTVALRAHFHNTRNTGLANAYAAVEAGVAILDASAGGIGGCPFAPAATGSIPTEDLGYLLGRMGVATGLDLDALSRVVEWLDGQLGHRSPGLLARAGPFPRPAA